MDGDTWFRVTIANEQLRVESNGTEERFRSLFRLDEDVLGKITKIVETAPELSPYVAQLPGLRVMKPHCVVEETFCFLCTPNNNLSRILKMVDVLASYGDRFDGTDLRRFPSLAHIADLPEHTLRARGFGYRAKTIPDIAGQVLRRGGEKYLLQLRTTSYRFAHGELTSLKGVGPKLADCICLFALHHTEAVPVDTHLWQASVRLYFPDWKDKALTGARYRAIGDHFRERFGPLAGFAHQYLFYDNLRNWRNYRKG